MIPYNGYDTINLISNIGDTIHCFGTGKQYFTTRFFELYPDPACGNHGTEKLYEAYKIVFVDSIKSAQIELEHYKRYLYNGKESVYDIIIRFKSHTYIITDFYISNPEAYNYIGDVAILDKNYAQASRADLDVSDSLKFIYINRVNGILQIQLNPTEIWYLMN